MSPHDDLPQNVQEALDKYKKSKKSQKSTSQNVKTISKNYGNELNVKNKISSDNGNKVIGEDGANDRDESYTDLLKAFVIKYSQEKDQTIHLKNIFFGVVLGLLSLLGVAGVSILVISLFVGGDLNIPVVIGASIDILAVFITIPTIIAKHLFPEKLDELIVKITELLINNDQDIRIAAEQRAHDAYMKRFAEPNRKEIDEEEKEE